MKDDSVPDIPVPSLPLIGILYAQLGGFSRRAKAEPEPEATAGVAVAEDPA